MWIQAAILDSMDAENENMEERLEARIKEVREMYQGIRKLRIPKDSWRLKQKGKA